MFSQHATNVCRMFFMEEEGLNVSCRGCKEEFCMPVTYLCLALSLGVNTWNEEGDK
jgi:hypothetical protein